jgi:queuosine precursor transporter
MTTFTLRKPDRSDVLGIVASILFIATIVAANYVTTRYGIVPLGFGLVATAGTYFVGLAFILRDAVQDLLGRWVFAIIGAGAVLSFAISSPAIAVASATAFLLSELADLAVYTPLRERGYLRAAVASNIVGAVVDTAVFLTIAGFPLRQAFVGQVVGKLALTLLAVLIVTGVRVGRRTVPA